jgi:4,5-dihydroxyphthalate decarboxylase
VPDNVKLSLAIEHYDRNVPLLEGSVTIDGVDLQVMEVAQSINNQPGTGRHQRMLRGEFGAAEMSLSSYLMACDQGYSFTAVPAFPRRLFSQSLFWVLSDSPLSGPASLAGKRIAINSYQTTVSVLAKGDLEHEYGVPWKDIGWVTIDDELLPFDVPPGVKVERAPAGASVADLLLGGAVDAALFPRPPSSLLAQGNKVRRLFVDGRSAEEAYFRNRGYWPIMHVVAIQANLAQDHPWLPRALFDAFERAKEHTASYYFDPNWSSLAWAQHYAEQEKAILGDAWRHGMAKNRANLEEFTRYAFEQGLIRRELAVEQLFNPSVLDT